MQRIQILYWKDVRDAINAINPEMVAYIDPISPSKEYPLLKIRYHFGDLVIKNGVWYLPLEDGTLTPISDHRLPLGIQKIFDSQTKERTRLKNERCQR